MERSTYTVTHHGLLIGLYGKTLEEHFGEYGLDIFANAIMRYAHERGQRMRKRAVRDGRRLDHETFLSYGELQIPSNPDDYSIGSESPVYTLCCHRCMWQESSFHTCISDILGEETASLITRRTAHDFDTYTKDGYSKDILAEAQQDFSEI